MEFISKKTPPFKVHEKLFFISSGLTSYPWSLFQKKPLLLKSSLLAIVSWSRGNSSDFFQLQRCYSEPTQSAVKQQMFCLLLPITKKTKHLINAHRGAIHRVTMEKG